MDSDRGCRNIRFSEAWRVYCRVEGLAKEFQSIGIDIHPQTAAPPNHPSVLENPIDQIRRVHTLAEIL